jgi:hypothetical protein
MYAENKKKKKKKGKEENCLGGLGTDGSTKLKRSFGEYILDV